MLKKLRRLWSITTIDVIIYSMTKDAIADFETLDYSIQIAPVSTHKKLYFIEDKGQVIHKSFLFKKLFLLKIINEVGPAIGDCSTLDVYKGKSIYPFVINFIAQEELRHHHQKEVFIIVNSNNKSSIRGIEKAGFKRHSKIQAKRFLIFHFNVQRNSN